MLADDCQKCGHSTDALWARCGNPDCQEEYTTDEVAALKAELRKYEPSDGVMQRELAFIEAIREAATLLQAAPLKADVDDLASGNARRHYKTAIAAWLALPIVNQARKAVKREDAKVITRTCPECGFKHSLAAETSEAAAFISEVERQRDSWQKESEGTQETLDEASALLERVEAFLAQGTPPGDLLGDVRLFLGPQRCSMCKSGRSCNVHTEEVYVR